MKIYNRGRAFLAPVLSLMILAAGCASGSNTEGQAASVPTDSGADNGNAQEGESFEIGDCLSTWLSLATFVVDVGDGSGLSISRSFSEEDESVLMLDGAVEQRVVALHQSLTMANLAEVDFLASGLADELDRWIESPPAEGGIFLVGRSNIKPARFATVLLRLDGKEASGFDPCTLEWRDITDELDGAVASLGAADALDALSIVIAEAGDDPGGLFATGWEAANPARPTWVDRGPQERYFTDTDLPEDIAATLVPLRIKLSYDQAKSVDETNPFALCPHQATAISGYCVPLVQLLSTDGLVLEVAIDPTQAVEIWLHDERHDPLGSAGPIFTLDGIEIPTELTVSGGWPAELQPLTAADAARLLSISGSMTGRADLDSPDQAGLPLVGGFGPVETLGQEDIQG